MSSSVEQLIEPLSKSNLTEFSALIKAFFTEFNIAPEFYRHDQDVTAPLKTYAAPRGGVWLARPQADSKAVGLAAVRPLAHRTCELKRLYVLTEHRGQGIGQALLNQVFQFGREQEYMEILLSTSPNNKPALMFCEKNGFTYCARYNDDNRSGLFMSYNFPTDF